MNEDLLVFSTLLELENLCTDISDRVQRREGTASDYDDSFSQLNTLLVVAINSYEKLKRNRELSELTNAFIDSCIKDGIRFSYAERQWQSKPRKDFFEYMTRFIGEESNASFDDADAIANEIVEELNQLKK